jgi:RNA polymerase sigma-70 factor (ECF subfamily)
MSEKEEKQCQQWMQAAQQGDKIAYASVLKQVEQLAHRYLAKRMAVLDDRGDLVQEILISVHKARTTYDAAKPFYPWLYALFHYRLQDYLRRYYRLKDREEGEKDQPAEDADGATPEENASHKQLSETLLSCLTPKQRSIVEMLYYEGYSAKEVAEKMEISVPDVRTTAHRSMKQLRQEAEKVG